MFSIFNKATFSVSTAALILAAAAFASRILGLVRDRIFAGMFGAGQELDIYFAALRLPDFIYSIIMGGAVSAAFIPVFISYIAKDKEEAWEVARAFFYSAALAILFVASACYIFMPQLMPFIAPGFDESARSLAVAMSRIMLLSPIFLGFSAVFTAVLQSFRKFFIYSLAPIFYNAGIIFGALFFTDFVGSAGLAWGVALGAFLHMLVQVPVTISSGFNFALPKNILHPALMRIFKLMTPRTIGLLAFQINLWVITAIATTLSAGSVSIFNFANNIQYLPIGIIGISFATAVFPALSEHFTRNEYRQYLAEFSRSIREVLFLVIPLSVLIFVLRAQIVRIVLGTGQFNFEDTRLTAASLGAFSFGIFAYALSPVIARAFYAQENTKTPVIANIASIILNIALSLIFIFILFPHANFQQFLAGLLKVSDLPSTAVIALPVALAISGIASLVFLFIAFFRQKRNLAVMPEIINAGARIGILSLFTGFSAWGILRAIAPFIATNTLAGIFTQTLLAALGAGLIYGALAWALRYSEFFSLLGFIVRKAHRHKFPRRISAHPEGYNGFS